MTLAIFYCSLFKFCSANRILYFFIYFSPKFISGHSKVLLNLWKNLILIRRFYSHFVNILQKQRNLNPLILDIWHHRFQIYDMRYFKFEFSQLSLNIFCLLGYICSTLSQKENPQLVLWAIYWTDVKYKKSIQRQLVSLFIWIFMEARTKSS